MLAFDLSEIASFIDNGIEMKYWFHAIGQLLLKGNTAFIIP